MNRRYIAAIVQCETPGSIGLVVSVENYSIPNAIGVYLRDDLEMMRQQCRHWSWSGATYAPIALTPALCRRIRQVGRYIQLTKEELGL
jgi:hypothetical protein